MRATGKANTNRNTRDRCKFMDSGPGVPELAGLSGYFFVPGLAWSCPSPSLCSWSESSGQSLAGTVTDDAQRGAFAHPQMRAVAFGRDEVLRSRPHGLGRSLTREHGRRSEKSETAEKGRGKGHGELRIKGVGWVCALHSLRRQAVKQPRSVVGGGVGTAIQASR